jgi:CheY-like chemotaxis protein
VEQADWQVVVQLASADALHCASHDCSSCAAQASSQLAGAHCVAQLFWMTTVHCALASISMFPHSAMAACAVPGSAASAVKATAADAPRTHDLRNNVFMASPSAIDEPGSALGLRQSLRTNGRVRSVHLVAFAPHERREVSRTRARVVLGHVAREVLMPTRMNRASRILLVDDNADFRETTRFLLQGAGYVVEEAGDGRQALEVMDDFMPDLVLIDVTMPVMSGAELVRELELRGELRPFGVVAMSGIVNANRSPTKWFLAKPVEGALLLAVVNDFCAGYAVSPLWARTQQRELSTEIAEVLRPSSV